MNWCNFNTNYAGICGVFVENGSRCEFHLEAIEKLKRIKGKKFSGYSKYRASETGEFQGKAK